MLKYLASQSIRNSIEAAPPKDLRKQGSVSAARAAREYGPTRRQENAH